MVHVCIHTCITLYVQVFTGGGVNVDNLDETSVPPLFSQHSTDGVVGGGEGVEEAKESPQLALSLLCRHTSCLPPLTHCRVTGREEHCVMVYTPTILINIVSDFHVLHMHHVHDLSIVPLSELHTVIEQPQKFFSVSPFLLCFVVLYAHA